jgi:hypothetical protein
MSITMLRRLACVYVTALILGCGGVAHAQSPETILEWNRILLVTLSTPGATSPTVFFTRGPALMHVAIYDALNSFDQVYTPYFDRVSVPSGASRDAAVAQAAHDTLVAMYPTQTAVYDAALAAQLSRLPATAAQDGARVGAAAARAILELRRNDGWDRPTPSYLLPNLAGYWQPVPPANAAAQFGHYADVTPFVIGHARQFNPEPPPALTSQRYADDFNEVKALGGATSTTRTADQTLVARLFAPIATVTTTSIPAVWNNLARDLVRARNVNDLEAARLYALVTTTFHDALFASFSAKFLYGFWRPVTAIREAAGDGNAATAPDPEFTSLIPTPPYPTILATTPASPPRSRGSSPATSAVTTFRSRSPGPSLPAPALPARTPGFASWPTKRRAAASTAASTSISTRRRASASVPRSAITYSTTRSGGRLRSSRSDSCGARLSRHQ